ncbi:MAG: hypothetical protein ACK56I_30955 [bacterium]
MGLAGCIGRRRAGRAGGVAEGPAADAVRDGGGGGAGGGEGDVEEGEVAVGEEAQARHQGQGQVRAGDPAPRRESFFLDASGH